MGRFLNGLRQKIVYIVIKIFMYRYQIKALGVHHIPASGGALLLGNHLSLLDWAVIIPFYLQGLWGSWGSHASLVVKRLQHLYHRHVTICYGEPLDKETSAPIAKQAISKLSIKAWTHFLPSRRTIAYQWLLIAKKV